MNTFTGNHYHKLTQQQADELSSLPGFMIKPALEELLNELYPQWHCFNAELQKIIVERVSVAWFDYLVKDASDLEAERIAYFVENLQTINFQKWQIT